MPQTSPDDSPPQRREFNAYALAAVLLLHVALLIAVLWWRAQPMDVPPSQHRTEITLLLPKPPMPPKPDDAGAKPATRPSLALPAAKSPELQLTLPPREQLVREAIVPVVSTAATRGEAAASVSAIAPEIEWPITPTFSPGTRSSSAFA